MTSVCDDCSERHVLIVPLTGSGQDSVLVNGNVLFLVLWVLPDACGVVYVHPGVAA